MDPFTVLGISADATPEKARSAWREKARRCHPDVGGTDAQMQELNEALRLVLLTLSNSVQVSNNTEDSGMSDTATTAQSSFTPKKSKGTRGSPLHAYRDATRLSRDISSFTIDCLPVEAFEALLIASSWHGDIAVEESPYLLEIVMRDPFSCWVHFDVVPEAGASMVSIAVSTPVGQKAVSSEDVRDLFVDSLNQLNWNDLHA